MSGGIDENLSFEAARAELEAIVAAIDEGAVDLDALSAQVARAGALLVHCRRRITATRAQVEALVSGFEGALTDAAAPSPPEQPF
ncbi:MAG TPA: exodeoxyribonuclease VII small subunit [Acidimicrobiia bacterium]|nr:exodeoxyribonuclease VII small subunit [Acidimicrobiia bacterium]